MEKEVENARNSINTNEVISIGSDYEILTGEKKDKDVYISQKNIIKDFIDKCNQKKYEEAYELLTQECKELEFPSIEVFKENYVDLIFDEDKHCSVQSWNGSTYEVKITEDLLENGKTLDNDYVDDYITISGGKLNINNYVRSLNLEKKQEKANVNIEVNKIYFYIDYAVIKINVTNNRQTPILLDSLDETGNIYLKDKNEIEYKFLSHEKTIEDMDIRSNDSKQLYLKFELPYSKKEDFRTLTFNKVLSDYDQYKNIGESRIIQFSIKLYER